MPIGTSKGEYFEDQYDYTVRASFPVGLTRVPIIKDEPEGLGTRDNNVISPLEIMPGEVENNVVHPDTLGANKDLDKWEVDPTTGTGLEIAFKRPPGASTEPADALESEEGSQTPENVDWTKMNQPFGSIKGTAPEDTPVVYKGKNITIHEGDIDRAINVGMGAGPGTMMGIKAKAFDKNLLAQAQILEQRGFDADTIWSKTGVFKGPDGRWRQEIDDSKATINPRALDKMKETEFTTYRSHP
jgi:hypothetical protein